MNDQSLPLPPPELLELATAYQRSKVLFALVEMAVPTLLAGRALPLHAIAQELKIHPIAADRFLNSGVALGLMEKVGGEYRNSALAQEFLVKGKPAYLGDQFLKYDRTSYPIWSDLTSKLRGWKPGEARGYRQPPDDQGQESLRAQHNLSLLIGNALGKSFDFSTHNLMLDLGGGTGAMSIGICAVTPGLQSIVFELPGMSAIAESFVKQSGMSERVKVETGNFKEDSLPLGFDVALLANLLSVASEETNRHLLKKIYAVLPAGGVCILSGWILDDSRTSPLIPVLFCLEDISWDAPDVERTAAAYGKWLEEAGFTMIERINYCPPTSMIIGRKPPILY
jgi:hypothetical protein